MIGAVTAIIAIPMFVLNSLAGLIGGAWLLWLGEWKLVVASVLLTISAPLWTSLLLIPGMVFAAPALAALEKGQTTIGVTLAALSALWTYTIITVWCLTVFWYVPTFWSPNHPILPFLLFAYATATGPWAVMAQKEARSGGAEAAQLTLSAACIGSALILGYVFLAPRPAFGTAMWLLIVPMVAAFLLSILIAITEGRRRKQLGF
ncbi:hypothetical protein [Agrobacterium tumefaciens]|uniref:hypothetical protein n=1 Tax=Agrobacterium tumefaciens TaxID=358 RepID=UPI0011477166